jgi:hypothetical protein
MTLRPNVLFPTAIEMCTACTLGLFKLKTIILIVGRRNFFTGYTVSANPADAQV